MVVADLSTCIRKMIDIDKLLLHDDLTHEDDGAYGRGTGNGISKGNVLNLHYTHAIHPTRDILIFVSSQPQISNSRRQRLRHVSNFFMNEGQI